MRMNIYNRCLELPVAYFNEERKGDLLSRMSNDMKEIEFALMVSLEALYMQPLTILLFLSTLLILSPQLTLHYFILAHHSLGYWFAQQKPEKKKHPQSGTRRPHHVCIRRNHRWHAHHQSV
jgi:ABC-type bacteriocin/lantibiotic exporter with double-glycine peptidase domain